MTIARRPTSSVGRAHPPALRILDDIGLGFSIWGNPPTPFSGGEAQRIKSPTMPTQPRSHALRARQPTTGLHMADTERLVRVLQSPVDRGNTVVVIGTPGSHQRSDCIVDLVRKEEEGGRVVGWGTLADLMKSRRTHRGFAGIPPDPLLYGARASPIQTGSPRSQSVG
jgi:excinuclease ABC subunit A